MRIDLSSLEEQFSKISSGAQAIETLYEDLELLALQPRPGLAYAVLVLAESIREANRKVEEELSELMNLYNPDCQVVDVAVQKKQAITPDNF